MYILAILLSAVVASLACFFMHLAWDLLPKTDWLIVFSFGMACFALVGTLVLMLSLAFS